MLEVKILNTALCFDQSGHVFTWYIIHALLSIYKLSQMLNFLVGILKFPQM